MSERLRFFNQDYQPLGIAEREKIHASGEWHETFHCWLYYREDGELWLYFQQRSATKKDFPNLLDITAAGHILATETPRQGIRELHEELGVKVSIDTLEFWQVLPVVIDLPGFHDREFANVYLWQHQLAAGAFYLQESEVQALYAIPLKTVAAVLFEGATAKISGWRQEKGKKTVTEMICRKEDFAAQDMTYYRCLLTAFQQREEQQTDAD